MDRGPVRIRRYDPSWSIKFETIRTELIEILPNTVEKIFHIGSTAVEGLGAKATIDVLVTVQNADDLDTVVEPLKKLGFSYRSKDEREFPFRRYFVRSDQGAHIVHVHVVPHGHEFHTNLVLFRDFLRKHTDIRDEYHLLKTRLANKYKDDREGYQKAKSDFIDRMTQLAKEEFGEN